MAGARDNWFVKPGENQATKFSTFCMAATNKKTSNKPKKNPLSKKELEVITSFFLGPKSESKTSTEQETGAKPTNSSP